MRIVKVALPGLVLSVGLLISTQVSFAHPEDTKKTKKPCATCHLEPKGGKKLTDAGDFDSNYLHLRENEPALD